MQVQLRIGIFYKNRKSVSNQLKNSKWNVLLTTYEYVLKDKNILKKY